MALDRHRPPRLTGCGTRARAAAGAAALIASAALVTGCGGSGGAAAPQSVPGTAGPAGLASAPAPSRAGDASPARTPGGSTSGGGGTPPASPGGAPAAGGQAGASGGTAGGGGAGPSRGAPAPGRCHTQGLSASVVSDGAGAGNVTFSVVLTNTSSHTCTVYGYPGMAFLDSGGSQVSVDPRREGPGTARVVTLAPGGKAQAGMRYENLGMSGAPTVTPASVAVTPPDETAPLRVPWQGGPVTADAAGGSVPSVLPFTPGAP